MPCGWATRPSPLIRVWRKGAGCQGNRTSKQCQQAGEVPFIPGGAHELAAERSLGGVLLHDVQRHVSQHSEVVWSISQTGAVLILVHDDVQAPVQAVLHAPMLARDFVEAFA